MAVKINKDIQISNSNVSLNDLIPSMITARGSTVSITTTADNETQKVVLPNLVNSLGNKLSYNTSTGEVTIGAGVSYVKVSVSSTLQYQSGSQTYSSIVVLKNGTAYNSVQSLVRSATQSANNYNVACIPSSLVAVNQGDKIAMGIFLRIKGSTNMIYPILSVEAIA